MRALCLLLTLTAALGACSAGQRDAGRAKRQVSLGVDDCAAAGDQRIAVQTAVRIARAQSVSARRACELALRDALFAAEAERRFGAGTLRSAALAHALLHALKQQAEALGAASEEELARMSSERWAEVDRPPSARTAHAVVLAGKDASQARAVAERLQRAVAGVSDAARFIEIARQVPTDGLELRAERLPPVAADGRTIAGADGANAAASFDPSYAKAANAIAQVGDQSPLVQSKFGFHVILLEEKLPERRLSLEERRALFEPEIHVRRARKAEQALLERLRQQQPPERNRAAAELLAQVRVAE
jgi:peptidyl-prolyl cis-trans isomerase C